MASNNTPPAQDDDGGAKTKMTLSLKSSSTGCNALVRKEVVEYWKSCSVLERISLTTIDKTTIIRKLKQRHKHRCSCENCMRRRVPYFDDEVHFYDQIVSILEKRDLETIDWDFEEKLQLPFCCHHSKEHQEQNEDNKEPSSHEDHEQSGIFLIFGQKLYIEEGMLKIHPKALAKQDLLLTILEKLKRVVEENHNMCEEQGKKEKNRTCEMCSACIAFEFLVCKAIVEKVSSAYNHRLAVMKADQMVQVLLKEEQQKSKQKMKKKKKKRSKRKDQDDDDEEDDDSNSVATMDSLNQFIHDDPVFGSLEDDNGSEESSQMEYDTGSSPTELSQEIDDAFDSENGDPFADFLEFREKEKWEVVSKPRKVKQVSAPSSSTSSSSTSSSSTSSALTQPQTPQKVAANQPPRQTRKHQSKLVLPPRLQQQLLNNSQHSPQHSKTQAYLPKDSLPSEDSISSSTVFATQVFHTTIPFSGQYHTSCFSLPTIFGQYNSSPLYASWVMNPSPNNSLPANSNRSDSLYFGILV